MITNLLCKLCVCILMASQVAITANAATKSAPASPDTLTERIAAVLRIKHARSAKIDTDETIAPAEKKALYLKIAEDADREIAHIFDSSFTDRVSGLRRKSRRLGRSK